MKYGGHGKIKIKNKKIKIKTESRPFSLRKQMSKLNS